MRQMISSFKKHFAARLAVAAALLMLGSMTSVEAAIPAEITGVIPASGPLAGGPISITGVGLAGTTTVLVDFTPIPVDSASDTQINLTVPAVNEAKTVLILVFAPAAPTYLSTTYTYTDASAPAETIKPLLTVAIPSAKTTQVTQTNAVLNISGKASDASEIDRVEVFNSFDESTTPALLAETSSPKAVNWTAKLNLPPNGGEVEITVNAYDKNGNVTTEVRNITFVRRYILTVGVGANGVENPETTGRVVLSAAKGTFSSLAPAKAVQQTATVEAGTMVTLTATAAPGYIFSEWVIPSHIPQLENLSHTLSGRAVTFEMPAENIGDIRAFFRVNPFLGLGSRANLIGLLGNFEGRLPTYESFGLLQASLTTSSGAFSGSLLHRGAKTSFTGQAHGDGSVWFKGPKGMTLELEVFEGQYLKAHFENGELLAEVGDDEVTVMSGTALVAATTTNEALLNKGTKGVYNVAMPVYFPLINFEPVSEAPNDVEIIGSKDYPAGAGFGTVKVSNKGVATFALRMPDGSSATMSSRLAEESSLVPLFVQTRTPGTKKEYGGAIAGMIGLDPEYPTELGAEGMVWFRPQVEEQSGKTALAKETQIYTNGWENGLLMGFFGAQHDSSITLADVLAPEEEEEEAPVLRFAGGKLDEEGVVKTNFTVEGNKLIKGEVDKSYNLVVTASTGAVGGSFKPQGQKARSIKGIMINQGSNAGVWGYFISNDVGDTDPESGSVSLGAQAPR